MIEAKTKIPAVRPGSFFASDLILAGGGYLIVKSISFVLL